MKNLKIIVCFALAFLGTPICARAIQQEYTPAIRLEDPDDNDRLYAYAINFFDNNEDTIRAATEKMLSSGMERIGIYYHRGERISEKEYRVSDEIWVANEVRGEKIELFDAEYLNLANCKGDFRIINLRLCENGVAVDFEYCHDPIDFLRVHEFGYYYVPSANDESIEIEDILAKYMPDEWTYRTKVEDEYQLVRISDDFIYYYWHG